MKEFNLNFQKYWTSKGKEIEPTMEDVKAWHSTLPPTSSPNFETLFSKIQRHRTILRNNMYLGWFHSFWAEKKDQKEKDGKPLAVTIFDLKTWWTNLIIKKKPNLIQPDPAALFKEVQKKKAHQAQRERMDLFWNWWLEYKFQKERAGVKLSKPTIEHVKWWFGRYHFVLPPAHEWLRKLNKEIKEEEDIKETNKNCRLFSKFLQKTKVVKPSIFDLKTWWLRRKAIIETLVRPKFTTLEVICQKKRAESRFLTRFKAWWKGLGKKVEISKEDLIKFWKETAEKGEEEPMFDHISLKLKEKYIRIRHEKLLVQFKKWWRYFNAKRNVRKANPLIQHFKMWWAEKKDKKEAIPDFTKLYALYYFKQTHLKIKKAFMRYWEKLASRLPNINDIKAWWKRDGFEFNLRNPDLVYVYHSILATEYAKLFKVHWKEQKKHTLPGKNDVRLWVADEKKKDKTFKIIKFRLLWKAIKLAFSKDVIKLPNRMIRTYKELKYVHKKLVEMATRKSKKHSRISKHMDDTRKAYLKAGTDLKVAEHAKKFTQEHLSKFQMFHRQKENNREFSEKEFRKAKIVANQAWVKYHSVKKEFDEKKRKIYERNRKKNKRIYGII